MPEDLTRCDPVTHSLLPILVITDHANDFLPGGLKSLPESIIDYF